MKISSTAIDIKEPPEWKVEVIFYRYKRIASASLSGNFNECKELAHLISAAPDMYKALKSIAAGYEDYGNFDEGDYNTVIKALQKAEGE